ncbi:hypothetical protein NPIL_299061 [Nephila pilipes]|uniref:Uncharacterized protein n=1 Tax=Nephila pilipes TaxID=299642 RepID=A0A8X6T2R2_NEPPI|nr:hypothetical protein NPIL_299061 [Nephila pilipes]
MAESWQSSRSPENVVCLLPPSKSTSPSESGSDLPCRHKREKARVYSIEITEKKKMWTILPIINSDQPQIFRFSENFPINQKLRETEMPHEKN